MKERLELSGNMFYRHHALEKNSSLGKLEIKTVRVKVVNFLKVENVLEK